MQAHSPENEHRSSIVNEYYEPEAATNFFDELEAAVGLVPDYRKVYQLYNQIFQKFLNQQTSQARLNFGGAFAKTDYLLKEHDASRKLVKTTNDARVRLRKHAELSESDLQQFCLVDLMYLCQFIAFICECNIPASLLVLFPTEKVPTFTPMFVGECTRAIVEQWDDDYLYVQTEESLDENLTKVCYAHGNTNYNYDWTYLRNLFYPGAQINLVRPKLEDGVIYPELIIFEPDYLVNISTVAHCFTNYADSALVEIIKKLEPSVPKEPIVLGNLAGQLLDESIHQLPNTHSYADSVRKFFKDNAISLLTAGIGPEFHSEAQKQKQNIMQAMQVSLPTALHRFNSKEGLVEPSFFSEMLGLQGRMDYLQMDFKVLLEQKSGKGAFPYDNFTTPRHTEEHYVQLLLYMALIRYNYKEIYESNGKELHAFLLYSKYRDSLLRLGFTPQLIFEAIRIRNEIAWTELGYAQPDGYRMLDELTPDDFNLKQVKNNLWVNYQRPQIAEILDPIHQASALERAYYYRFLTFISNEHVMSKLGNRTKESSGFAATWHDCLSDKLAAGNIYDKLTLEYPNADTEGSIKSVVLKFAETEDNDMSNFRTGDIVMLYPYVKDKEPDARKTMVFRCTIEDIQTDRIYLALRASQSDNRVFVKEQGKLWAIEHDFMESSYNALYKGMQSFLNAPKSRRDLLLLQRETETDRNVVLRGDYGEYFNDIVLRIKRAKDLFLLIGPPGTGKTSYGLLYTVMEEYQEPGSTILLLSYTNRAVDEICSKLTKEKIDFIRLGGSINCAEEYRSCLLSTIAQQVSTLQELKQRIDAARIFVGTTTSMNNNIALFSLKQFSLAVIDEASQILEPHLMGLLSAKHNGVPAIRKFVLIGDHKQLPAVVQQGVDVSRVDDALLNGIHLTDCRLSLFERLLKYYYHNPNVTARLVKQGRMHHDIALFPNYAFYANKLEEVPLSHQVAELPVKGEGRNGIEDLLRTRRIVFIASEAPVKVISDKVNQTEADMIAAVVCKIYEIEKDHGFSVNDTVGVIVPYRNQIAAVRKAIDRVGLPMLHDITIDTVERYQGSQRKYIVYGFTIQKYYQLNFLTNNVFEDELDGCIVDRKLNVAMTRAEEHLIMIGNAELLANNFTFFKLMEFVRSKHGFFRIGRDEFVSGSFDVPPLAADEQDLSEATFTVSPQFDKAFEHHVVQPIQDDPDTQWPSLIFGHDKDTNLTEIGYGRIDFTNQQLFDEKIKDPKYQVLIYCYYIMWQHYCSSRNIYTSFSDSISSLIRSVSGRVQMIDMGCGPATCGISFAELFKSEAPTMLYTGIDVSIEMKRMAEKLLDDVFGQTLHYQLKESFSELDTTFWDGCSELPSLVVINISYFFSNVQAMFAERLAMQISEVMQRYPLNRYLFVIQHSDIDRNLNSFHVFKRILKPLVVSVKSTNSCFSYQLNHKQRTLDFCYDIWIGK